MTIGFGVSTPAIDQVPVEMKAQCFFPSTTGMPVTAEAVSWVAGATTGSGRIASSSQTCFWIGPISSPGITSSPRIVSGMPRRREDPLLPGPSRSGRRRRAMVASVYSVQGRPVSR